MLPYEELLKKYNLALQTIDSLRAENIKLKSKLGIVEANASATTNDRSAINKYSSVDTKIRLFRKLFSGREDVFARRWYHWVPRPRYDWKRARQRRSRSQMALGRRFDAR